MTNNKCIETMGDLKNFNLKDFYQITLRTQ